MIRRRFLAALGVGLPALAAPPLLERWRGIARGTDGAVGAAALHLGSGKLVSMNGDEPFPLASVCKLPIAMHFLALVDEGKLTLDQEIEVLPEDVWAGVSDIEKRWPAQLRYKPDEMLELMVAHSDNTAEETLFRIGRLGSAMAARFRQWKIDGVRIDRSERQCDRDRSGDSPRARYEATLRFVRDPRDTGTPNGTVQLLTRAFRGELLSPASTARLTAMLKATTTFPTRLKGLLPEGTVVAHKTGSSGTVEGFTAATNDSGVIFLPDGGQLAVSVYIKASTQNDAARDRVIARLARAAFDSFS